MFMPQDKVKYYEQERLFGDEVFNQFPSARMDIQEAGNCYAMGRYTACVFHLMRVLEIALKALWVSLNTGAKEPRDWGGYLTACDNVLKDKQKLEDCQWKEDEDSLRNAYRELLQIKKLWRNETMHSVDSHGQGVALDILVSSRVFMQHIATKLSEVPAQTGQVQDEQ